MEKCPWCGESAIIEDDSHQVCAECGIVLSSEVTFHSDASYTRGTTSTWMFANQTMPSHMYHLMNSTRVHELNKKGLEQISQHGKAMGLSEVMIQESKQMFSEVYTEYFLNRFKKCKLILAAACVYCVCRLHDFSVAIHQICDFVECDPRDFSHVYKELCLRKQLVVPGFSTGSAIVRVVSKLQWENSESVIKKTQNVLHLFEKNWLVTGRSPDNLIIAALFVVWTSNDFPSRRKVTLNAFCKQHKLCFRAATQKRYNEVMDLLMKLSENIPWLSADSVSKKTVIMYVDDILKYQRSLMLDIVGSCCGDEDNDDAGTSVCESETAILPPCLKKRRVEQSDTPPSPEPAIVISNDLDGEELTEADMNDDELRKYIRDPAEVKMVEKIKIKCKQTD